MKVSIGFTVDESKVGTAMRQIWELGGEVFACTNAEPLKAAKNPVGRPRLEKAAMPAKKTKAKAKAKTKKQKPAKTALEAPAEGATLRMILANEIRTNGEVTKADLGVIAGKQGYAYSSVAKDLAYLVDNKFAKRVGRGRYAPGSNKAEAA